MLERRFSKIHLEARVKFHAPATLNFRPSFIVLAALAELTHKDAKPTYAQFHIYRNNLESDDNNNDDEALRGKKSREPLHGSHIYLYLETIGTESFFPFHSDCENSCASTMYCQLCDWLLCRDCRERWVQFIVETKVLIVSYRAFLS